MNVSRKTLVSAVAMLSKVVANRPTLPILSHVVLKQNGPALHMVATNLDLCLTLDVTPTTPDPERLGDPIAVPAKEFLAVLKSMQENIVSLKSIITNSEVEGVGPSAKISVSGPWPLTPGVTIEALTVEDFPSEPTPPTQALALPNLTKAISRVTGASSSDESRYAITGVFVDTKAGNVVATDGHRLYRAMISPGKGFTGILNGQLTELLDQPAFRKFITPDSFSIKPGTTFVPIQSPEITGWLSAKVIEGTFPNYEQVIPNDDTAKSLLMIKKDVLLAGLTKASAVAEPRTRMVELILENGRAQILGKSDRGQAQVDMEGSATGDNLIIGVNGHYLEHALESCANETVTLLFKDYASPMWLHDGEVPKKKTPATWASMRLDIVIMPMRSREQGTKAA